MMDCGLDIFEYSHDAELYEILETTVVELLETEDEFGRISSYTMETEFGGWDMWGRKYVLLAEYVWLPIKFENDVPKIYWLDEWKIEDVAIL